MFRVCSKPKSNHVCNLSANVIINLVDTLCISHILDLVYNLAAVGL